MGWTQKPVETRPEGPRAGVGFLAGGSKLPPHQLWDLGSAVSSPSGVRGGKFGFWSIVGLQKSRLNGQQAFESEGATSEYRGHVPPAPRRTAPGDIAHCNRCYRTECPSASLCVCLYVCRLSHSCILLKPLGGMRCRFAGTFVM